MKVRICSLCEIDPEQHKVYMTDWIGEPVRSVTKEKQSIFDANFGRE